ncbi:MAG: DEAD/DEAH box helicase, partial [Alphaproteobacteria bacterium]|nr:DEAD/DEAH box helicase [Alphaproteobacteria bacterium]
MFALESGFETEDYVVIAEQDVFGDRLIQRKRSKRAANFLSEAASLTPGDLVVHVEHGIGQFDGLETITVSNAPHDCLKLIYYGGDKLFLPVENIDLISRYGSQHAATIETGIEAKKQKAKHEAGHKTEKEAGHIRITLDRLGSANWQMRKARVKERLRAIADELIRVAAARMARAGKVFSVEDRLYDEFCARFPFDETDDQKHSIAAIIDDLASGRPMDRLVCGDVGFGKTEIALRAAFIVALSGAQTALIVPTTLLARQHAQTFRERFAGLPVEIGELSRLVGTKRANETKAGVANGRIDIVIGTHALLQKHIQFANLGLVIIDEEQHFGVQHKEQLKKLHAGVHVLTLTATPIPRTLQLALADVRDLSLITTPPIDRLAVRTYITPFDKVIMREVLLREKYRTGQSFFICPYIADLDEAAAFLRDYVPEIKFIVTHGQMAGRELETRIAAFYDGQYDVLLSTSIIESGLDIPTANTIIISRADRFGLAHLYQMRGRVGRAKARAYAYLTYEEGKPLSPAVEKRLQILQSLDSLGAGFTLASYDLDLRGAGNLLGAEQSGHVREVGFELYQSMLEEAVAKQQGVEYDEAWSPQLNINSAVLLPDDYIADFEVRMGLYRRLANLETEAEINKFKAELIDRFGDLPAPAQHLLQVIAIKRACVLANIEKLDVGAKGAVLSFRKQTFANPAGLAEFIANNQENTAQENGRLGQGLLGHVSLRRDHALVFKAKWGQAIDDKARLAH